MLPVDIIIDMLHPKKGVTITNVDKPKIKYRRFTHKVNSLVVDRFLVCSKTNKEKHITKLINQSNEKRN